MDTSKRPLTRSQKSHKARSRRRARQFMEKFEKFKKLEDLALKLQNWGFLDLNDPKIQETLRLTDVPLQPEFWSERLQAVCNLRTTAFELGDYDKLFTVYVETEEPAKPIKSIKPAKPVKRSSYLIPV